MDEVANTELMKLLDLMEATHRGLIERGLEADIEAVQKLAVTVYLQSAKIRYFSRVGDKQE